MLFFSAHDGVHGFELWQSDGSDVGTALFADIAPGAAGSGPASITLSGAHVFFSADPSTFGEPTDRELWAFAICSLTTEDADGDGVVNPCDNCPGTSNTEQSDFDDDARGDACESGAIAADADDSGFVDGFDLAMLGRAFGSAAGEARYEPRVDYDRNGLIDGEDLALLAPHWARPAGP
jgi:ELWxxDGT repeat protein